jgi:hypothetical protein
MISNLLAQSKKQKKELTEKQSIFIDELMRNGGSISQAIKVAGYSEGSRKWLVESVRDEIIDRTKQELALNGPKAASRLVSTLDEDGTTPKGDLRLKASESLLNRIGIGSNEAIDHNVQVMHGVVLLPSKKEETIEHSDE